VNKRARLAAKEIAADLDARFQLPLLASLLVEEVIIGGKSRKINLRDDFLPEARRALARNPHVTDGTVVVALAEDEEGGWVPHLSFRSRLRQPLTYIETTVKVR
jgi:hypothetical protein